MKRMIPIRSKIEQQIFVLYVLVDLLRPNDFIVECICQLDKGFIDLTIIEERHYYIIRIPFYAVANSLSFPGITVRVEQPQLLITSQYMTAETNMQGHFMLSRENIDQVGHEVYLDNGKHLIQKVEKLLLPQF